VNVDLLAGEFDRVDEPLDDRSVMHVIQFTRYSRSEAQVAIMHGTDTLALLGREQYCVIRSRPDLDLMELTIAYEAERIPMALPLDRVQPKMHLVDVEDGTPVLKPVPQEINSKLLERLDPQHQQQLLSEI